MVSKRRVWPALLACAAALGACTSPTGGQPVDGTPVPRPPAGERYAVDPSFVQGSDGSAADRLAATVVSDVQDYWRQNFPSTFGKQWRELRGGYHSVDSSDRRAKAPPCTDKAADVEGNAYYCPSADAMAWDRAALLPVLIERFGEGAVMLVLAHEMGHAAQRQSGLTRKLEQADPERYPTIVIEAMADCYAGAVVRWIVEGKAKHLRLDSAELDSALGSLITFRDPIGTSQSADSAHGDAFDRVSAFQDGYRTGPRRCADIDAHNRTFTQREFVNLDDQASGGNMAFDQLTKSLRADVAAYFSRIVASRDRGWQPPELRRRAAEPKCTRGDQGPVEYCPNDNTVVLATTPALRELHRGIGDYATGTLIGSRYGMSVLRALDRPLHGRSAQRAALCLAGSYTSTLLHRTQGFALSPGDLDEAVQLLLAHDYPARDTTGAGIRTGFERVSVFRSGVTGGARSCGLD